ncbi:hypothetical protein CMI37_26870 [Candidatus Pacearchaeota archaeon]|nr:hypothetical protein [Candidatus Pacearchaeota archaeon]|tara:strand:+ start:2105 stop:2431 length:327 start_codon:yes stop_codon:yes gene_type:complete
MEKRISLFEVFGNNIITRNSIFDFFTELEDSKEDKIVLDFKDITFISRSCADEYLKQRKISKKAVIETNMSKDVCNMFDLINKQYKKAGLKLLAKIIPRCESCSLVFA